MQPMTALPVHAIKALETLGHSQGLPLMQRAGQCAAEFVMQHEPSHCCVWILVGPGNNGGDALAAGSILQQHNYQVYAIMPGTQHPRAQDAHQYLAQWRAQGNTVHKNWLDPALTPPQFVIDGLFGIGLNKPLDQPWQSLIDWVNNQESPVLALDIPSGIMADTGQSLGRPIKADWTLALIAPSLAMNTPNAQPFIGQWTVCRLGLVA